MNLKNRNIKGLSKEEKLYLYDLIQEKKKRLRATKLLYQANTMQSIIHACTKQIRVVLSGNGAGKTVALIQEAFWAATGYNPSTESYTKVPARVIVVLDHPSKVKDKWIPEFKKWFNFNEDQFKKDGKPYISRIEFPNASEISFMFHEQPDMAFESIEAAAFIYDEPPPRRIWYSLMRGGREKNYAPMFLLAGTPIAQAWIRQEILEPWSKGSLKDTECFRFDSDVNKDNLNWAALELYFERLSEKEKQIRRHGMFFDLEGLALSHLWKRDVHIITDLHWDEKWPCVIAIDPHPSKAHHAVMAGADKDDYIVALKEMSDKCSPREFARRIKSWYKGYRVTDIVVDSLGSQDMTGGEGFKSFIQVLNEEGIRARSTTYEEKQDEAFIARIQDALLIPQKANNFGMAIPKLRVHSFCRGLINDIENVQWARDKRNDVNKPKLDISNKDFLACLKYALATNIHFKKGKEKVHYADKPTTYGGKPKKNKPVYMSVKAWLKD